MDAINYPYPTPDGSFREILVLGISASGTISYHVQLPLIGISHIKNGLKDFYYSRKRS